MTEKYIGFPNDFINPEEKNTIWGLQVAEAIWYQYQSGNTCWGADDVARIKSNILYSNGMQPIQQYLEAVSPTQKTKTQNATGGVDNGKPVSGTNDRKDLAFLAKTIVSPMPKVKELMLGLLEEIDHDLFADSIDNLSITEKEKKKHTLWVKSQMMPLLKKLEKENGIPAPKMSFEPKEWEDLQMYEMVGGFKLAREIGLEQLGNAVLKFSEWKKISRQWRESLWDNGKVVGRVEFDPYENQVKLKYISLEKCVIGDRGIDVKNPIPYAGHVESMSVRDLENRLFADGATKTDIEKIIKSCQNSPSNDWARGWDVEKLVSHKDDSGDFYYRGLMVDVFCFEYISSDRKYMTSRINSEGDEKYHEDTFGTKRDSDKRKTKIIDNTVVYEGNWLIGTKFLFGFQKVVNQIKPDKKRTRISYFYADLKGLSKVERCIGFIDGFNLSYMKLQAAKAQAAPKGIAIEINSLMNMNLGSGNSSPLELVKIYKQTGTQYYRSFSIHQGAQQKVGAPITELAGGIGPQLDEWSSDMSNNLVRIFEMTGFNDVSAASPDVSAEMSVAASQIAMQQTNNSLKPLYEEMTSFKEDGINLAIRKAVTTMSFDSICRQTYVDIIGRQSVEYIETTLDVPLSALGIKMVSRPSQEMINNVRDNVQNALMVGKNGEPLITLADSFLLNQMLEQGKAKEAGMYLAYRAEQTRKDIDERAQANSQQQSQNINDQIKTKSESELALINAKGQVEIQVLEKQKEIDLMVVEAKTKGRIEELQAEAEFETQYGTDVRNQR